MSEVFNFNFEAGDFSEFDTTIFVGPQLYVSATGAISGTYSCNHEWATGQRVLKTNAYGAGVTIVRCGALIKLNSLNFGTLQTRINAFHSWTNGSAIANFGLVKSGSNVFVLLAGFAADVTGSTNVNDGAVHTIEYRIEREGNHSLYVDGLLEGSASGAGNGTLFDTCKTSFWGFQLTSMQATTGSGHSGGVISDDWITRNDDVQIYPPSTPATDEWTAAPMKKPCAISMDGNKIFIAALDSLGQPVLIDFSADLASDGTIIFEPGAGDNIGVQAGRKDANVIWVGGNFGGTDVLEKSDDAGASFTVKDPGTFDPVSSFSLSPISDETILAATNLAASAASGELWITFDGGDSWQQLNSSTGIDVTDIEMLDRNDQEIVIGGTGGDIAYSPNDGADLEDYGGAPFPSSDVTKIIVG